MAGIRRIGLVGGGVIGAGWAARFIADGHDVVLFDPAPGARAQADRVLANADRALGDLLPARRAPGTVGHAATLTDAVEGADLVVESVPERLDLKRAVYADIEAAAPEGALIASSTSGLRPSDLQAGMAHPERLIVAHPFVPVYLIPLVEIVAGEATAAETVRTAMAFYAGLGMKPLHVRKEIEAFIADRLLEAVWREALWLVHDGVATTEEIDETIRHSFGLRWAQMGLFEGYRIAGGEAGMRHFMAQFGPCLKWPWSKLTDVPEFTDALVDLVAEQSDAQSGHLSVGELERIRDDNLVAILKALESRRWGAGEVLARYREGLEAKAG